MQSRKYHKPYRNVCHDIHVQQNYWDLMVLTERAGDLADSAPNAQVLKGLWVNPVATVKKIGSW
jgi:hypothetical protein